MPHFQDVNAGHYVSYDELETEDLGSLHRTNGHDEGPAKPADDPAAIQWLYRKLMARAAKSAVEAFQGDLDYLKDYAALGIMIFAATWAGAVQIMIG